MSELINELTDWHNLLQGGVGSLLGSLIGVLGAYVLAVRTIRGQQRADRELAREQQGVEAAGQLARSLGHVDDALRSVKSHLAVYGELPPEDSLRYSLVPRVDEFGEDLRSVDPLIPDVIGERLRVIHLKGAALPFQVQTEAQRAVLDRIKLLDETVEEVGPILRAYRRDPLGTIARLERERRKRRRRGRWTKLWQRARRPALRGSEGGPQDCDSSGDL